jgi:hypothetical protein
MGQCSIYDVGARAKKVEIARQRIEIANEWYVFSLSSSPDRPKAKSRPSALYGAK